MMGVAGILGGALLSAIHGVIIPKLVEGILMPLANIFFGSNRE